MADQVEPERLLELNDRLHPLVEGLAASTVALCRRGRAGFPYPAGSGVLIRIKQWRYLLTASHIFDDHEEAGDIYAIVASAFVRVSGARWRTKAPPGARLPDRTDLAIVSLGPAVPDPWASCRLLTLDDVDPLVYEMDGVATGYLAIGYPNSMQPKVTGPSGTYAPFAHHFFTHLEPVADKTSLDTDPSLHIAIGYNPRDFTSVEPKSQLPKPIGMSGGGVWRIPDALLAERPLARLAGILIEYHTAPHHVILATRIASPLRALAALDPKTAEPIEAHLPGLVRDGTA